MYRVFQKIHSELKMAAVAAATDIYTDDLETLPYLPTPPLGQDMTQGQF